MNKKVKKRTDVSCGFQIFAWVEVSWAPVFHRGVTKSAASWFPPVPEISGRQKEEDMPRAGRKNATEWLVAVAQHDFTAVVCACARSALGVELSGVQSPLMCEAWPPSVTAGASTRISGRTETAEARRSCRSYGCRSYSRNHTVTLSVSVKFFLVLSM